MYVVNPVPFGLARNAFGGSFAPVGKVTVWMMSTPRSDVGNPANWKTKVVPRTPRAGTALIDGSGTGGGGGGGTIRAGVAAAEAVAAGAAVAGADTDDAPLGPLVVALLARASDGAAVDVSATSQAEHSAAASARTSAAARFGTRPR